MGEDWEKERLWELELEQEECLERVLDPLPLPLGNLPLKEHPLEEFPLTGCPPLGFPGERVLQGSGKVDTEGGMILGGTKEQEGKFRS